MNVRDVEESKVTLLSWREFLKGLDIPTSVKLFFADIPQAHTAEFDPKEITLADGRDPLSALESVIWHDVRGEVTAFNARPLGERFLLAHTLQTGERCTAALMLFVPTTRWHSAIASNLRDIATLLIEVVRHKVHEATFALERAVGREDR
jgi:hypothetical protein